MNGLSKETAEALIFTARSTYLCVKYLINDLKFFYVLTRSFKSDAVESLFGNVRLRGGCNDLTDCRTAEYALRQILRSGLIKCINSGNTMNSPQYFSNARLEVNLNSNDDENEIIITLNDDIIEALEKLTTFEYDGVAFFGIDSAATAFLCGYLIMKVEESLNCELCLSLLRNTPLEKTNPLLELIYNQDRGRLNYPNEKFVALITLTIQTMLKILPNLPTRSVDLILQNIFVSYLRDNPIFQCKSHFSCISRIIVAKLIPATLKNYCNLQSEKNIKKRTNVNTKKRKLLKLN